MKKIQIGGHRKSKNVDKVSDIKFAIVDDDDFLWLDQWKWSIHSKGYAYRWENGKYRQYILMHRLIGEKYGIIKAGQPVFFVNGDRLDNRQENLRAELSCCTKRIINYDKTREKISKNIEGLKGSKQKQVPVLISKSRELAYHALVDEEDFDWISGFVWRDYGGYPHSSNNTLESNSMHRCIALRHSIISKDQHIDHINTIKSDNRKCNLRPATIQENNRNRGKSSQNMGLYKGVSKSGNKKKPYKASIWVNNKRIHLGCFEKEIDAALEYDKSAIKHHKGFANINFN